MSNQRDPQPIIGEDINVLSHGFTELTLRYGEKNVEQALIYIARSCDRRGKHVMVKPSMKMLSAVLDAVYGYGAL